MARRSRRDHQASSRPMTASSRRTLGDSWEGGFAPLPTLVARLRRAPRCLPPGKDCAGGARARRWFIERPGSSLEGAAVLVLVGGLAGAVGWFAWRSVGWPLVHDAPLMHYVAWRMAHGAVPYRDVFDMNFPGVYLLHLLVVASAGVGDLAWRVFDLGWLAATGAVIFALTMSTSRP